MRRHVHGFARREQPGGDRRTEELARWDEVVGGRADEDLDETLRETWRVVERRHHVTFHRAFGGGRRVERRDEAGCEGASEWLSLIHISEPTRLGMISYAV